MSKQIPPHELAALVVNLLLDPKHVGEPEEFGVYHGFMEEIGTAITNRCGGEVNQLNGATSWSFLDGESAEFPYVSISPNECLPETGGIWQAYDPHGWEGETVDGVELPILEQAAADAVRMDHLDNAIRLLNETAAGKFEEEM